MAEKRPFESDEDEDLDMIHKEPIDFFNGRMIRSTGADRHDGQLCRGENTAFRAYGHVVLKRSFWLRLNKAYVARLDKRESQEPPSLLPKYWAYMRVFTYDADQDGITVDLMSAVSHADEYFSTDESESDGQTTESPSSDSEFTDLDPLAFSSPTEPSHLCVSISFVRAKDTPKGAKRFRRNRSGALKYEVDAYYL